jgi:hypothetical protein
MNTTRPAFDMSTEELRRCPLCILCSGRNTRWAPSEDDPRETVWCFDCVTAPLLRERFPEGT